MAAQLGCQAGLTRLSPEPVAVAKARTSEAAQKVASMAHAIHGAIGFTEEYDLQLYTRRLYSWRRAAGSEGYWHEILGRALVARQDRTLNLLRELSNIE
jgi:acyl-CoA dehydrogenase